MAKAIVHDGVFHADDVCAVAMLKLFVTANVDVVRTRDEAILAESLQDSEVWVLDVGKVHDPLMKNFDHHQDKSPKAAVGRVAEFLAGEGISYVEASMEDQFVPFAARLIQEMQQEVLDEVDLQDTGNSTCPETVFSISKAVSVFNCRNAYSPDQDIAFAEAVSVVERIFRNFVETKLEKYVLEEAVEKSFKECPGPLLILGDAGLPWKEFAIKNMALVEEKNFTFAVFETGGSWRLQSMPDPSNPTVFSMKIKIGDEAKAFPVNIFVHPAGFIAGFTTEEDAVFAGMKLSS